MADAKESGSRGITTASIPADCFYLPLPSTFSFRFGPSTFWITSFTFPYQCCLRHTTDRLEYPFTGSRLATDNHGRGQPWTRQDVRHKPAGINTNIATYIDHLTTENAVFSPTASSFQPYHQQPQPPSASSCHITNGAICRNGQPSLFSLSARFTIPPPSPH